MKRNVNYKSFVSLSPASKNISESKTKTARAIKTKTYVASKGNMPAAIYKDIPKGNIPKGNIPEEAIPKADMFVVPEKPVTLSKEQQNFIEAAKQGENILVDACIGSGKTTAIQHLCDEFPKTSRILYLTYNRLLKVDAKSKIKNKNATVTNYHGFAAMCLYRMGISAGVSDLIQCFNRELPDVGHYDVLIIDEYQDIEQELAEMLEYIKDENPGIQIIAVGDMEQKIYDKTTLDVARFIHEFLGTYKRMEFTYCFRLQKELAEQLGRIWQKKIIGVNDTCKVIRNMDIREVTDYLSSQKPEDILCLGSRTGDMSRVLNKLESDFPEKFNKSTVYASISDNRASGATEPKKDSAIFTTYDSSKGLERKICVIFDYTEAYWSTRINKPQQSYEILRNIFCVAASRGKQQIIFVKGKNLELGEKTLSTPVDSRQNFVDMDISAMFDFKYKENVEECFSLLETEKLQSDDCSEIDIKMQDELIDISPCVGIYQEAMFFDDYDIEKDISLATKINDNEFLYTADEKQKSLEEKILFLSSVVTKQNRYRTQVKVPFVKTEEAEEIKKRLGTEFLTGEEVQRKCQIDFTDAGGNIIFKAKGYADVVKNRTVYELKFVSEVTHEHFLQCACYMIALGYREGFLWNIRDNSMYRIRIPDRKKFMDAVTKTVTKQAYRKYYLPV